MGYKKDFDEIQTKFAHLFYDITTMLEEAPEVTLEELKKFLIYRDLKPLLQEADTITKVMLVVRWLKNTLPSSIALTSKQSLTTSSKLRKGRRN